MDRRTFLRAGAAGTTASIAGCFSLVQSGDRNDGPPRLSVDGRWLTDPQGNRIVLRGVNVVDPWWGVEYADVHGKGFWDTLSLAVDRDAGWHSHVIRFPVEPRTIEAIGYETLMDEYLDRAVELTREAGVYAIIDYHAIGRYDTVDIDQRVRDFWSAVAPRYADQPHVIYELFNEPTEPARDGLSSWRNWRTVATPWVELVRSKAPETPIIVGSPMWTTMTRFAPTAPFEVDDVVYSAHVFPSWEEASWEPNFGTPALDVPVFLTEWGYTDTRGENTEPHMIGSTSGYGEPFRAWLDRHENVSWCAWSFAAEWYPPMFDHDWNLLGGEDYMGAFTQRWLAEKRGSYWPPGRTGTATPTPGPNTPPSQPENLRLVERGPSSVDVAWDSAADPDGDVLLQYRVATDGETVGIYQGTVTEATLDGLLPGTEYLVTVTAVDSRGATGDPARLTVTTLDATDPIATIPKTATPPTIDGVAGDVWADVAIHAVENVLIREIDGNGDDELAGQWQALWDETAIYFHVAVTDPESNVDSDMAYQNDNLEIYLDPDYSRGERYDGENDAQLTVQRGDETLHPGPTSVGYPSTEVAVTETDDGWAAELAIPWSDAGVTPQAGMPIGMDVHVTDDVDGGDRDVKLGWFSTTDESWQRPDTFATVTLGE